MTLVVLGALAFAVGFIIGYDRDKEERMPGCSHYSDEYKS